MPAARKGGSWSGFFLALSGRFGKQTTWLLDNAAEEVAVQRREAVGMPRLGTLAGGGSIARIRSRQPIISWHAFKTARNEWLYTGINATSLPVPPLGL